MSVKKLNKQITRICLINFQKISLFLLSKWIKYLENISKSCLINGIHCYNFVKNTFKFSITKTFINLLLFNANVINFENALI